MRMPGVDDPALRPDPEAALLPGEQTAPPQPLPDAVLGGGDGLAFVRRVLAFSAALADDPREKRALFRRRTAREIIASGFATGCTDNALAAVALLRALGVPAVWVETVAREWLEGPGDFAHMRGHVFVEVHLEGGWRLCDPQRGRLDAPLRDAVVVLRGRDSWDVGVRDVDDMRRVFAEAHARHHAGRGP